jgi:predicted transcriptional regulator
MRHSTHTKRKEVRNMKKLFAVTFLALIATVPSFGAEHVVTRSAKTAGKESVQVVKYSAAKVDHAAKATIRFLF